MISFLTESPYVKVYDQLVGGTSSSTDNFSHWIRVGDVGELYFKVGLSS